MTDYYPHHSNYDHHQQAFSGHSLSHTGDPTEDNGIRRTATHGSHQSHHTQASVSASTRSWVYSNQMNPPPPPLEPAPSVGHTPFHGPRPLPEPNGHRRPFRDVPEEDEDEEDYLPRPQDTTQMLGGLHFAYQPQAGGPARYIVAGPSSSQSSPVPPPQFPTRDRSFVGGFFKGLKRIPRIFRGGRGKRQHSPLGTEANTDLTTGNTLPRYLSNPSIGPTNPQFAHRLSQAVANGSLPADITPSAFQIRPPLVSPQQPVVTVTAPSDGAEEEQHAEYFEGPPPLNELPQIIVTDSSDHNPRMPTERATMMAYNRDSEAPTVTQTHPTSTARASVPHRSPSVPRVSYPAELPTRASTQAQMESFAPIPVAGHSTTQMTSPLRSLHRPTLQSFASSRQTPEGILSPPATSAYTVTTATSYYDPSFSSDLTPVEKFFKAFYHLPWVSHGRVTVDYRPGDSPRAKGKLKSLKKPLSSWYYSVMSRSRRNSVDLMSSNTASTGRGSNMISSLASPGSRRSGRSANHRHRSPRPKHHHRSRRRHTTSTSTGGVDTGTHRSASPIVPTVYPYAVPPYLPYTYPYLPYTGVPPAGTMPGTPPPLSPSSPRGPRAARSHSRKGTSGVKYPHGGYTPFQPLVMPPQSSATIPPLPMNGVPGGVYFITPSPPQSHNGDGSGGRVAAATRTAPAGAMQLSPVIMHYIPAALRPDGVSAMVSPAPANMMVSPPATPQKPTPAASHNSHHSHHA